MICQFFIDQITLKRESVITIGKALVDLKTDKIKLLAAVAVP
jgi:hypothetical protein